MHMQLNTGLSFLNFVCLFVCFLAAVKLKTVKPEDLSSYMHTYGWHKQVQGIWMDNENILYIDLLFV